MEKYVKISIALFIVLSLLSLLTHFNDSADQGDYTDIAKYFSGNYAAKVRTSHSLLYGFINAPLVGLVHSFVVMKVTGLIFLLLLILSIYLQSGKDNRTLLLTLTSPIVWYMGTWITPVILTSLFFSWSIYFLKGAYSKYNSEYHLKNIFYSGALAGLAVSFWDGSLPLLLIFIACFFYDRKLNHLLLFLLSIAVGMIPLFLLNQIYYGFPFYSIVKYALTISIFTVYGGFNGTVAPFFWQNYLAYILMLPFTIYLLFNKEYYAPNKREINFLILSLIFVLSTNPQLRCLMLLWPVIIINLSKNLNRVQFKRQLIAFALISLLVSVPYLVQIKYSTDSSELTRMLSNKGIKIDSSNTRELITADLKNLTKDYPNQTFVVGNADDHYQALADLYWGNNVKEFVSIQDYNFFLENKSVIFEKTFHSNPNLPDRRQLWISGGIMKNLNDKTNYSDIELGIGVNEPISIENFTLIEKYGLLYLSEKKVI